MPATKENTEKPLPDEITRVGNLTRDPELRFGAEKGTPFTRFGLAVEVPVKPVDWTGDRRTEFYEVSCFGTLAEHVAQLRKGIRVVVMGRPELDQWKDHDGRDRLTKRIVANAIGPDLRWATAEVTKTFRRKPSSEPGTAAGEEDF